MLTRTQLIEQVVPAYDIVSAVRRKPSQMVIHALRRVMHDLDALIDTDDIEQAAWDLVMLADDVVAHFLKWDAALGIFEEPEMPIAQVIFDSFDLLMAEVNRETKAAQLESLQDLYDDGVTLSQIAKMRNWYVVNENGARLPDIQKAQEELEHPGTHRPGPNLKQIERQLAAEEKWPARKRPKLRVRLAPETVEQLIQEGVYVRQIARMHGLSNEEVCQAAHVMGLETADHKLTDNRTERRREVDATHERRRMRELYTYPDLKTLRERVLAMHADGVDCATISKGLQDRAVGRHLSDAHYTVVRQIVVEHLNTNPPGSDVEAAADSAETETAAS